jgi:predicted dehydrogenase
MAVVVVGPSAHKKCGCACIVHVLPMNISHVVVHSSCTITTPPWYVGCWSARRRGHAAVAPRYPLEPNKGAVPPFKSIHSSSLPFTTTMRQRYGLFSLLFLLLCKPFISSSITTATTVPPPFRLGIVGMVHDHINEATYGLPSSLHRDDIHLVGIAESNKTIVQFYQTKYNLTNVHVFNTVEELLDVGKPTAVQVFTDIVSHESVTLACAQRGVHVMVEKPLAVNVSQAQNMERAAKEYGIELFVNYITTWYPSTHYMYNTFRNEPSTFGPLRKATFRTGHFGTKEIGCNPWMVEMDMDPTRSGGGALMCFASYGLSIMTALVNVTAPTCVSATTRHFKTDPVYANVEDDATLLVQYARKGVEEWGGSVPSDTAQDWLASATVAPSWNWPWNRKDMDVNGVTGVLSSLTDAPETVVSVRSGWSRTGPTPNLMHAPALNAPYDNPLTYLIAAAAAAVNSKNNNINNTLLDPNELSVILSSLELSMKVQEAIAMAYESASKGGTKVCQ